MIRSKEVASQAGEELEQRPQRPRLVFVGGGSGTSNSLEMLRPHFSQVEINVVCTTFDDGGSSGILRRAFAGTEAETVGLGDIRRIIYALAPDEVRRGELEFWEERTMTNGLSEWNGHSLGNFYLLIATQKQKSFEKALYYLSKKFRLQGGIHPVTIDSSRLCAWTKSGRYLEGEHVVDKFWSRQDPIVRLGLTKPVILHQKAKEAIEKADVIIIGPGSHYTSLLPNLLVRGFRSAVAKAKENGAKLVYVANLVAEMGYGEPVEFPVSKYAEDIVSYLEGKVALDYLIVNNASFPQEKMEPYLKEHKYPIVYDEEKCGLLVTRAIVDDFLAVTPEGRFRHSPNLAKALLRLPGVL